MLYARKAEVYVRKKTGEGTEVLGYMYVCMHAMLCMYVYMNV